MDDDQRFLPRNSKKQKRGVISSDEDEDVVIDSDVDEPDVDDDDDDNDIGSTAKRRKGKAAAPSKSKAKGTKNKEEKEITIKDERIVASTSRASSVAAHTHSSDLTTNDDAVSAITTTQASTDPITTTDKDPADPLVPKKRKLPPIRKNKQPGNAATASSTPATAGKPPPLPLADDDLVKRPVPTIQQRKTALSGVQEVDLSNQQVYASLFKGGGNTPKSGLNRREKEEERRRELNRLRDDARAKRAEDAKHTFDLQAQTDKVARFERRLRAEGSRVLHPNFLAAKFRDEWEMDGRRRRDDITKEEGEA
ncbi:hypothetical protein V8B97DRAFT_1916300 [Scleroderma yunnanense]